MTPRSTTSPNTSRAAAVGSALIAALVLGSGLAAAAAPETTVPDDDTAIPTSCNVAVTVNDDGSRVVEHTMGATEVPADPQTVVVLDSSFLDSAIALGVTPAGATEGSTGIGLPAYLADRTADVAIVGETNTPNLEAVAALEPDVILGAKVRHEDLYDSLSAIAPTVFSESSGTGWTDQVCLTGAALGQVDGAEALLAAFSARATEVGEAVGAPGSTAVIVRFLAGQTRLYGPGTFSGSILTAVGFDLGDRGYADYSMAMISTEQYELIDADVAFVTVYGGDASTTDRPTIESLWTNLDVVQRDAVHDVRDDIWMTGIGVIGANLILDDIESLLGTD